MKDGRKSIGVIGGMGPLATQLFYRMIIEKTEADTDQDHINMVILSHATMPDRTAAIMSDTLDQLMGCVEDDVKVLEEFGADYIVIPCNTFHVMLDRIGEITDIPVINMIKTTADEIKAVYGEGAKVGIMATDGTIKWGLYHKACEENGLVPVTPSEENQKLVMKIIYEGVKKGKTVDYSDFEAVDREFRDKGCDCVIMACTELSCFKDEYDLPDYYVDPMSVVAEKAVILCDKKLRSN